ncbi:MAG: hypothetical protein ABI688_01020 [Bacteroidota bacterium]
MINPSSHVQPDAQIENKITINSFLKQSYDHAKKQVEDGINFLQDGVSFIKDEFSHFYDKAGDCINRMVLPANNFLKDLSQIETELQQEIQRDNNPPAHRSNIIPIEIAMLSPMEENY